MADHNYQTSGPKSFYAKDGRYKFAHSKDEQARIKEEGFTSANYVRSMWPTTAFHKKTGETKPVGKLEWTEEQNKAAVAGLGDDWTLDHVAVPEPPPAPKPGALGTNDLSAILSIMTDVKLVVKRVEELEEAAIQADNVRNTLELRIAELEHELDGSKSAKEVASPSVPRQTGKPAKTAEDQARAAVETSKA